MARKPMTTKDKIREWISDNLRYMLLGLAILVIAGLITLLVHLISAKTATGPDAQAKNPAVTTVSASSEQTETVSESKVETKSEEPVKQTEVKAESELPAESVSESVSESEEEEFSENNDMDVTTLCTLYYEALGRKDIPALRGLVDSLSDAEAAAIEANTDVSEFRDISVYTMAGLKEGTYIAFARYTCMYNGIATGLPVLSEIYVYTTENGALRVMEDPESDTEITKAMMDAQNEQAVLELIDQVTTNYEIALEKDPALEALVEKLS